jgi:hypothetical protein
MVMTNCGVKHIGFPPCLNCTKIKAMGCDVNLTSCCGDLLRGGEIQWI